jgi:hypothetical protein
MNYRYLLALALFALVLAGCQLELPPMPVGKTTALAAPFTLHMGESIAVAGEPVSLRLERWVDDKRCPATLTCAESGPVKVQITFWREGKPMTYPVFIAHTDQAGAVLADAPGAEIENKVGPYRITVTAVTPYPADAQPIPASDYQATFVITKDPSAPPDTDADMSVITERPFTLAPGEQVTLVGRETMLRVASVADGRCPAGESCTAGGVATVVLEWQEGAATRSFQLTAETAADGAVLPAAGTVRPFTLVDGVGIRLVRVTPLRAGEGATTQGDYRVTLALEPGPRMPNGTEFAEPGEAFDLTPGHTAVIGQDVLRVRFDGVAQDSRCPRLALCVQAGTVEVAVTVANQQQRATTYVLGGSTDGEGRLLAPAAIDHAGYTLRLTQVTPYPERGEAELPADAYVATFVVDAPAALDAPVAAATGAADTVRLPLLCINEFAVNRMNAGGADEPAVQFTEPLAQDAATDYGQAHALCNKTFGPEWVQAGPSNLPDFAGRLPPDLDFWLWDGMAGQLAPAE